MADSGNPSGKRDLVELINRPKEFVVELRLDALVGQELARRRIGRLEVGPLIIDICDLADDLIEAGIAERQSHEPTHLDQWDLAPESKAMVEHAELLSGPWASAATVKRRSENDPGLVLISMRHLANAVIDNFRSLGILLSDSRPIRAPYAMARVTIEAEAQLLHVVDPSILSEDRLVRCLNFRLYKLHQDVKHALLTGTQAALDEAHAEMDAILDAALRAGKSQIVRGSRQPTITKQGKIPCIGERTKTDEMLAVLHDEMDHNETWHLLSTVVHSQDDSRFRLGAGLDGFHNPHADVMFFVQSSPVLFGFQRSFDALGTYAGIDFVELNQASESLLHVWLAACGFNDEELEKQIRHENADWINAERERLLGDLA